MTPGIELYVEMNELFTCTTGFEMTVTALTVSSEYVVQPVRYNVEREGCEHF